MALKTFAQRDSICSVGNQIGVGKESDIYIVADKDDRQYVLKIQRLGRISFRNIKSKRDYLHNRKSASWMYMSRLAAKKEYAFMKILHENGFPVPTPIDQARHCVVMELIDAFPLRQITEVADPGRLYSDLMSLIVRLARHGLIHGDFNEFNILVHSDGRVVLIDFPQMVSTSHRNAEYYFNRDVNCIRTFFKRRFGYESLLYPKFTRETSTKEFDLDVQVAASGFTKKQGQELETYMEEIENDGTEEGEDEYYESTDEEDESQVGEENDDVISEQEELRSNEKVHVQQESEDDVKDGNSRTEDDGIEEMVEKLDILAVENDDENVECNTNRTHKPFRESGVVPLQQPVSSNKLTDEEIRKRVQRTLQSRSQGGRRQKDGGRNKGRSGRKDRDVAKHGANDYE